jgi:hypothetical protein
MAGIFVSRGSASIPLSSSLGNYILDASSEGAYTGVHRLSLYSSGRLITLWDFMKELLVHGLYAFSRGMENLSGILSRIEKEKPNVELTEKHGKTLLKALKKQEQGCEYLHLPASKASCEELIEILEKNPKPRLSAVRPLLVEFSKRIEVELKAHTYFFVPKEQSAFYQNPLKGWETTKTAFPAATYDIEEAGKCLALGRNTSSVFHLMRVLGAGITALGKSLNEPTLDASHNVTWDNVLSRCVKELGEKYSFKSAVWQSDKEFYAKATATLLAVKDAWRNPNAHEVGQKYTDDEAEDIYRNVRRFMEQLSIKLHE